MNEPAVRRKRRPWLPAGPSSPRSHRRRTPNRAAAAPAAAAAAAAPLLDGVGRGSRPCPGPRAANQPAMHTIAGNKKAPAQIADLRKPPAPTTRIQGKPPPQPSHTASILAFSDFTHCLTVLSIWRYSLYRSGPGGKRLMAESYGIWGA